MQISLSHPLRILSPSLVICAPERELEYVQAGYRYELVSPEHGKMGVGTCLHTFTNFKNAIPAITQSLCCGSQEEFRKEYKYLTGDAKIKVVCIEIYRRYDNMISDMMKKELKSIGLKPITQSSIF